MTEAPLDGWMAGRLFAHSFRNRLPNLLATVDCIDRGVIPSNLQALIPDQEGEEFWDDFASGIRHYLENQTSMN